MSSPPVHIAGIGIVSPLGSGTAATLRALLANRSAIAPLRVFSLLQGRPLPVGQVQGLDRDDLPRCHRLALIAAEQAMAGSDHPPDAVILGTTTGGILTTEELLRRQVRDREAYRYHGLHSVTDCVAGRLGCRGPALTVSTACSSGAVALALALRLLRSGRAERVLAGGVDSLCRLTYFGFHSLQLVDPLGCRPLAVDRRGMAVGEGAAMLLLTTRPLRRPAVCLLGAGLSCDAYHPAKPHPEGSGARAAMEAALADAGLTPADIAYINLHGTGTPDNDLAEARAVRSLFPAQPLLSSIKGATGHGLAASGAIEAAVAAICVSHGLVPANTGCREPDPALGLRPVSEPGQQRVDVVLSNSFGFGGNNGSLVIGRPGRGASPPESGLRETWFSILGSACMTGVGSGRRSLQHLLAGRSVAGMASAEEVAAGLSPGLIRRLKRLPRMALALALAACADTDVRPSAVCMGTGWGAISETHDFLQRLSESEERYPSPMDFVGSVHNAPASQVAILLGATGANITAAGGDCSFEQALLAASLVAREEEHLLVLAADEYHGRLSPLLDPSIGPETPPADGGGALLLCRGLAAGSCRIRQPFLGTGDRSGVEELIDWCGGPRRMAGKYGLVLAGIPAARAEEGEARLQRILQCTGMSLPVVRYRDQTGEFASASAVAAVLAAALVRQDKVPAALTGGAGIALAGRHILVLGLSARLSAMELVRS